MTESYISKFPARRRLTSAPGRSGIYEIIGEVFAEDLFDELERLATQKLLEVAQQVAREKLPSGQQLWRMAQSRGRSSENMRAAILEFLEPEDCRVSMENCVAFLEPFLEPITDSSAIDLKTFGTKVALNPSLAPVIVKRIEFTGQERPQTQAFEPGLEQLPRDKALSGAVTEEAIEFLMELKFKGKEPSKFYYYRALQNPRDLLHFLPAAQTGDSG